METSPQDRKLQLVMLGSLIGVVVLAGFLIPRSEDTPDPLASKPSAIIIAPPLTLKEVPNNEQWENLPDGYQGDAGKSDAGEKPGTLNTAQNGPTDNGTSSSVPSPDHPAIGHVASVRGQTAPEILKGASDTPPLPSPTPSATPTPQAESGDTPPAKPSDPQVAMTPAPQAKSGDTTPATTPDPKVAMTPAPQAKSGDTTRAAPPDPKVAITSAPQAKSGNTPRTTPSIPKVSPPPVPQAKPKSVPRAIPVAQVTAAPQNAVPSSAAPKPRKASPAPKELTLAPTRKPHSPDIVKRSTNLITDRQILTEERPKEVSKDSPPFQDQPVLVEKARAVAYAKIATERLRKAGQLRPDETLRLPQRKEAANPTIWHQEDPPEQPQEKRPFGLLVERRTASGIPLRTDIPIGTSSLEKTGADKPLWTRPQTSGSP